MRIGVPSEIKAQESRIGLTPASVQELTNHGHEVLIQDQAGFGAGFDNNDYTNAGAKIVTTAEDIFNDSDMVVKVKEPLINEVAMLRENQILFNLFAFICCPQINSRVNKIESNLYCLRNCNR